jgi:hypothetical protein
MSENGFLLEKNRLKKRACQRRTGKNNRIVDIPETADVLVSDETT